MDRHHAIFLLLVFQICVAKIDSLSCLFCQNIDDPFQCNITVSCESLQVCFLHEKGGIYNMGCTGSQQCGGVAGAGPGIVGRSVQKKQSSECHECCSTDSCNSLLCQHLKPTSCRDDETVDCAKMNSLFHICADIHQASLVCPQFCNLCGFLENDTCADANIQLRVGLDGNWGGWSSWSGCDVTCSTGSQTRFRNCSDPAPAGGGLDCVGYASETKICKNDACPVHGGWSQWATWGSCSVTCGVGMQRRVRSCSKPYPSLFGDHCFGFSRDDRVCIPGACSDGAWSDWGSWGSCSHSCDGGIKTRSRTCTNPRPSMLGRYCDGDPNQMIPCSRSVCPDKKIAFTAYGLVATGSFVIFPTVYQNYGNSYNATTGIFKCHLPGIYHFVTTLTKTWGARIDNIECSLYHNYKKVVATFEDPVNSEDDKGVYSFTISATLHLERDDIVHVNCPRHVFLQNNQYCSFTGFLIVSDN